MTGINQLMVFPFLKKSVKIRQQNIKRNTVFEGHKNKRNEKIKDIKD